ncbi:hypothetical protein [Flavobacterium kingsejongi]|uniref:hypothetical protein n=1 Tax=Flavobacterium kingsejongi TaxID=1678728 RepID=UPI001474ADB1|nr:hypothetical protein [Flavobacterium kingsejongi]
MKTIFILFSILSLTLVSCNINGTNFNEDAEKIKAEKVADQLYESLKNKDLDSADALFSDELYKITSKEQLNLFFKKTSALGTYQSRKLIDWQSTNTVGTNSLSTCTLVYEVIYENDKSKETIGLLKDENKKYKIVKYSVNSDGLFK